MVDLNQLVQLNVELEGLLKVLIDRKSIHAKSLLADKFRHYSDLINQYLAEEEDRDEETPAPVPVEEKKVVDEAREILAEGHQIEVKDQEAEDSEIEDQDDLAEAAIEKGAHKMKHIVSREPNEKVLKAFTVNDKFRFTRELFNGDDRDYSETLNLISEMGSVEEVEDYLTNDLMWNPDDASVKEFLSVIAKAFK